MTEKPAKKNRLSLIFLVVLFLGSLVYALYDQYKPFQFKEQTEFKNKVPKYFDYGVITDSVYCNDFFNFRIPISKGYKGDYKKYDYIEKSLLERDSVPASVELSADIHDQIVLVINPELEMLSLNEVLEGENNFDDYLKSYAEKRKRESMGSDYQLEINVHRLKNESLEMYINRFENLHHPDYGKSHSEFISGIEFQKYIGKESQGGAMQEMFYGSFGGKNRNIISYFTEIHGFALSIDIFYLTEEQKAILLGMVDDISFH